MLTPKYSVDEIIKTGKKLESKLHSDTHTSFEDAFDKIEKSIEKKVKGINGEVKDFNAKVFLNKNPVDNETLDKLQKVYNKSGFNVVQESKNELVDYTGPSAGPGSNVPAEYETKYVLNITFR